MAQMSMTGQGQGRREFDTGEITAEVRSVNNRHLKIQTRTSDGLTSLEPKIEGLVRRLLRRGSLQINVQANGFRPGNSFGLDESVLEQYIQQCQQIADKLKLPSDRLSIVDFLALPGVVTEQRPTTEPDHDLESAVLGAVTDALECLNGMRRSEGSSMAAELSRQLKQLRSISEQISDRAPLVVQEYRQRLEQRFAKPLAEVGGELRESDLLREILLIADKSDIREEIVRLQSHYDQFESLLQHNESQGRKLDFLIQEMYRETNTIGSKAGDAEIAQRVVDVKAILEQMRELVQNLE
jgi:uncharacterized protein (TIGR00255 family)